MTYQEQLQHPLWKNKKSKIIAHYDGKCMVCRSTDKPLQVHHTLYIRGRMAWEYADDFLVPLCKDCHKLQHPDGDASSIPTHEEGWDHTTVDAFCEFFYSFQWN